jgi:heme exporter protein A
MGQAVNHHRLTVCKLQIAISGILEKLQFAFRNPFLFTFFGKGDPIPVCMLVRNSDPLFPLTVRSLYDNLIGKRKPQKLLVQARSMISIQAKNLSKRFGKRKVFDRISFSVQERSSLVITGKNGSGKTTLLKILSGLIRPTEGEMIVSSGERILPGEEIRHLLGLVMPDLELYDELTALENLIFLSRIRGLSLDGKKLKERIDQVGLSGREDDLVGSFSSGMKQRLKYALALLFEPKILLLDEPTTNLDEEGILVVERIISSQKEKGMVILATNEKRDLGYGDQFIHLGS